MFTSAGVVMAMPHNYLVVAEHNVPQGFAKCYQALDKLTLGQHLFNTSHCIVVTVL